MVGLPNVISCKPFPRSVATWWQYDKHHDIRIVTFCGQVRIVESSHRSSRHGSDLVSSALTWSVEIWRGAFLTHQTATSRECITYLVAFDSSLQNQQAAHTGSRVRRRDHQCTRQSTQWIHESAPDHTPTKRTTGLPKLPKRRR